MRTALNKAGSAGRAVVLMAIASLIGCESAPRAAPGGGSADAALVSALQQRTEWSAQGSLGIWTEETATTNKQNITASLSWSEMNEDLNIVMRGPLGVGEMVLTGSNQGASLRRGNSTVTGRDPSTLVQQALNLAVPVPLDELSSWMRGLPGSATDLAYDTAGRLISLRYQDATGVLWRASIRRYSTVDSLQVPSLITAVGGPYNVRLVLKQWNFVSLNSDAKLPESDSNRRLSIPGRSS